MRFLLIFSVIILFSSCKDKSVEPVIGDEEPISSWELRDQYDCMVVEIGHPDDSTYIKDSTFFLELNMITLLYDSVYLFDTTILIGSVFYGPIDTVYEIIEVNQWSTDSTKLNIRGHDYYLESNQLNFNQTKIAHNGKGNFILPDSIYIYEYHHTGLAIPDLEFKIYGEKI